MKQIEKNRQTLCRKTITFVLSLLLVCFALNTFAASIDFRNHDVLEALADCHVKSIIKDWNGFLWIGTESGLSRYDGFRFKNFYSR